MLKGRESLHFELLKLFPVHFEVIRLLGTVPRYVYHAKLQLL